MRTIVAVLLFLLYGGALLALLIMPFALLHAVWAALTKGARR